MDVFIIFYIAAAILQIASGLPQNVPNYLDLASLPNCARSCTDLLKASADCLASPLFEGAIDQATYIGCYCGDERLQKLNGVGGMCVSNCKVEDAATIQRYYVGLCAVPGSSVTLASTSTTKATPTSSLRSPSTTSTLGVDPAQTSSPAIEEPKDDQEQSQSWAQKHWKSIVEGTLTPVAVLLFVAAVAALYAWYTRVQYRRRQRPMTAQELSRFYDRAIQERLEEHRRARQGDPPPQPVDNSIRGRLNSYLRKAPMPTPNLFSNHRTRSNGISISTSAPLLPSSPPSVHGTQTPSRPGSARTFASSIGQRSVSSPLSPHPHLAPPLPIIPSTPRSTSVLRSPPTRHTPQAPQTPRIARSVTAPSSHSPCLVFPQVTPVSIPQRPLVPVAQAHPVNIAQTASVILLQAAPTVVHQAPTTAVAQANLDLPSLPPIKSLIIPSAFVRSFRMYKDGTVTC